MYKMLLVVIGLLLSGCASITTGNFSSDPDLGRELNAKQGVLFGSFSRNGLGLQYGSQLFFFKNVETGEQYLINSLHEFVPFIERTRDDFSDTTSKGAVFAFVLPEGAYTFNKYHLSYASGNGHISWQSDVPYSVPFKVYPNEINYVGEIRIEPNFGKNLLGMKVLNGGVWFIENKLARDEEILKNKFPEMSMGEVSVIVPTEHEIFTDFIVLPSNLD